MDSAADVRVAKLRPGWGVANHRLSGCTAGTAGGQFPLITLNLPGGQAIDASRFRTLTFQYSYEGTFNTRPVPSGGTFTRVFWYNASGRHPTNTIHLYPNERVAQIRLDDPSALFQGVERGKGLTGAPWAGPVTALAINPLDDKASRCFAIGRVWLTADEPWPARLGNSPSLPAAVAS